MEPKNSLTPAEWSVMEALWAHPGASGRTVTDALRASTGYHRSTTLTLLRRLEEKGAVRSENQEGRKTFYPLIPREDAALREAEDVLSRAYRGSVSLLVSALTRKQTLPPEELQQLRQMLAQMEGGEDHG